MRKIGLRGLGFRCRKPTPPAPGNSVFSIAAPSSANEGDSGLTYFTFPVTRSGGLSATASVAWATSGNGSNPASGSDFDEGGFPSSTLNFAIGETTKNIVVGVQGDTDFEEDEGFKVTISNPLPSGASISAAVATSTILNDDEEAIELLPNTDNFESDTLPFTAADNTLISTLYPTWAGESVGSLADFTAKKNLMSVPYSARASSLCRETNSVNHYVEFTRPTDTASGTYQDYTVARGRIMENGNHWNVVCSDGQIGQIVRVVGGVGGQEQGYTPGLPAGGGGTPQRVEFAGDTITIIYNNSTPYVWNIPDHVDNPTGTKAGTGSPHHGDYPYHGSVDNLKVGSIADPLRVVDTSLTDDFRIKSNITYFGTPGPENYEAQIEEAGGDVLVAYEDATVLSSSAPGYAELLTASPIPDAVRGSTPVVRWRQKNTVSPGPAVVATGSVFFPAAPAFGMNLTNALHYSAERIYSNLALVGVWQNKDNSYDTEYPGGSYVDAAGELTGVQGAGGMARGMARPDISGSTCEISWLATDPGSISFETAEGDAAFSSVSSITTASGRKKRTFVYSHSWDIQGFIALVVTGGKATQVDVREVGRDPNERITQEYIDRCSVYSGPLRFMDLMNGNGSYNVTLSWAERPTRSNFFVIRGYGMPVEDIIEIANRSGKDIWVNLPAYATSAYWTAFCQALHDGTGTSNGVGLTAGQKVIVEWGNEPENSAFPFYHYAIAQALAAGRITTEESTAGGGFEGLLKEQVFQSERMFAAVDAVTGTDHASRFVKVVCSLGAGHSALQAMTDSYGLTGYDALANSPYFGSELMGSPDPGNPAWNEDYTEDLDILFPRLTDLMNEVMDDVTETRDFIRGKGARYIIYEGQQHYLMGSPSLAGGAYFDQTFYTALQQDPRMKTLMLAYFNRWRVEEGDIFVAYNSYGPPHAEYGAWGFRLSQAAALEDSPKHGALVDAIALDA